LDNYERCLRACRDALIIEPNNLKALFRASVSLRLLNRFDEAGKYLSKANQIDPLNRDVQMEIIKLKEARDSALQPTNKDLGAAMPNEESPKTDAYVMFVDTSNDALREFVDFQTRHRCVGSTALVD
jgi:tetratricopeptide (TPR) repeat protein